MIEGVELKIFCTCSGRKGFGVHFPRELQVVVFKMYLSEHLLWQSYGPEVGLGRLALSTWAWVQWDGDLLL